MSAVRPFARIEFAYEPCVTDATRSSAMRCRDAQTATLNTSTSVLAVRAAQRAARSRWCRTSRERSCGQRSWKSVGPSSRRDRATNECGGGTSAWTRRSIARRCDQSSRCCSMRGSSYLGHSVSGRACVARSSRSKLVAIIRLVTGRETTARDRRLAGLSRAEAAPVVAGCTPGAGTSRIIPYTALLARGT